MRSGVSLNGDVDAYLLEQVTTRECGDSIASDGDPHVHGTTIIPAIVMSFLRSVTRFSLSVAAS